MDGPASEHTTFERLTNELQRPPFNSWIGARAVRADAQAREIEIMLPFRPEFSHHPAAPMFHGGIISALIDIAGYAAVAVCHGAPAPTISLNVQYLSPASAPELHARGILRSLGRSIAVADVEITAGRKAVALGRGTFHVGGGRE